jgi:hypothetical protein
MYCCTVLFCTHIIITCIVNNVQHVGVGDAAAEEGVIQVQQKVTMEREEK